MISEYNNLSGDQLAGGIAAATAIGGGIAALTSGSKQRKVDKLAAKQERGSSNAPPRNK